MPIQGMGSVQEQSTPEQVSTQDTFRRRMVLSGLFRFAPPRFAPLRGLASASLGFASLRPSRLVLVPCSVSFPRLLVSARSRLESPQVQQSVGWNLMGLGGGEFKSSFKRLAVRAQTFKSLKVWRFVLKFFFLLCLYETTTLGPFHCALLLFEHTVEQAGTRYYQHVFPSLNAQWEGS